MRRDEPVPATFHLLCPVILLIAQYLVFVAASERERLIQLLIWLGLPWSAWLRRLSRPQLALFKAARQPCLVATESLRERALPGTSALTHDRQASWL